jgi:hypothetical protein
MTDHKKAVYERTDTSLTFWDIPGARATVTRDHPLVVQNYEAYLVVEGRAAYVINWVVYNVLNAATGTVDRQTKVSGGRIPTTLPDFLADPNKKLYRGTAPGLAPNPDIENPIKGVRP